MSQFAKQFAIIDRIKALVKKTAHPFRKADNEPQISEDVALKIQRTSFDQSRAKNKDTFTSPYKIISEQLQVDDEQIFRGAVFNLTNIALTTNEYAADIVKVLEKAMDKNLRSQEQIEYIKNKITVIQSAHKL